MSQYLLLRNNKESGPFSLEEIIGHGLKPYDLVWVDGKSAAWRYPSELPELRPYAPVVEEQPFDRFYKKPVEEEQEALSAHAAHRPEIAATPAPDVPEYREAPQPAVAKATPQHPPLSKNIFVTLPAAAGSNLVKARIVAREKEEAAPPPAAVAAAAPPEREEPALPYAQMEDPVREAPYYGPATGRRNRRSSWLQVTVAACLLMGGVIIGLLISHNSPQPARQDLNKLVKQIIEQQKQQGHPPAANPDARLVREEQGTAPQDNSPATDQPASIAPADTHTANAGLPGRTTSRQPAGKKQQATVKAPSQEESQPAVSDSQAVNKPLAVMPPPAPVKPLAKAEAETARKSIQQHLGIHAGPYKTGLLGGISDLHLTLSNNSNYQLDLVEVEVKYLGPEKRVVNTQTILFKDLLPGTQLTQEVPKSRRGVTVDYNIKRISSKQLGLAYSGF